MRKLALHWQILIAILLAGVAGWITGKTGGIGDSFTFYELYDYLGRIFLNALKMIIVPLIMSSIIIGVAGIGRASDLGKLTGKTVGFYMLTGLLAVLVGLFFVNLVQPGIENGEPVRDKLALEVSKSEVKQDLVSSGEGFSDLLEIFVRMVPSNIVETASDNRQLLGLIFFAVLFGFFMTRVGDEHAEPLYKFWNAIFHVMMRITEFVMKLAPIGVFGLVAKVVADTGFNAFGPLSIFAGTVLLALFTHALVTMPLILRFVAKVNPWKLYRAMAPALLTAFSTASSSGTLPLTMECVEKNVGVSNRTSAFVLPLGATVNMNGSALYECVAVIFLAQAYGIDLGFGMQFAIVITALITSIGVAGVPSASLVAIGMIMAAVGLPMEGLGVLFVFDRILDMTRTALNVFGDGACAVIVARLQGEENLLIE